MKLKYRSTIILASALLMLWSCKPAKKEKLSTLIKKQVFNQTEFISAIQETLENEKNAEPASRFADTLYDFYHNRDFNPVWFMKISDTVFANRLFTFLSNACNEGLDENWYEIPKIISNLKRLAGYLPSDSLYLLMGQTEYLLSKAITDLHYEHCFGRINPKTLFGETYLLPARKVKQFQLFDVLQTDSFEKVYQRSRPPSQQYDSLQKLYEAYKKRQADYANWQIIDTAGISRIDPGDTSDRMPMIARNLFSMGFGDSAMLQEAANNTYGRKTANAVKTLQQAYGLYDDGVIGRNTLILLNRSNSDMKGEIAANMERIRWFDADTNIKPYVLVNQPEFMLYMHWKDSVKTMKVCIGKQNSHNYDAQMAIYRETGNYSDKPRNFETPQIYSNFTHMVLNPTWTVPASIVGREMLPAMKRDRNYLRKNNYIVLYKGKAVPNQDTINWKRYTPTNIPYKFVQSAGDDNALGKIKFMFPNPFHIYLHDTPQRSKFKLSERSVSHGCVRVEQPLAFGLFLMQQVEKFDYDDFRIMMGYPPEDEERLENYDPEDSTAAIKKIEGTYSLFLNKRIPVYFDYRTIWWDSEGKLQMRFDVYRRNQKIIAAMQKRIYTLLP